MRKLLCSAVVLVSLSTICSAQTITETFGSGVNAFTMDFVTIGNPGNVADDTGFGSVPYNYNLGKYEISREQIEKANSAGGLGIPLQDMTSFGGNGASQPATGVSWHMAAKFVNFLNTNQGKQAAYNFDGSGNFQLWGFGQYSESNQYRHKDAFYFLPSVDEWYKGAYGSLSGTWYNFSNASDSAPPAVSGGASGAVYAQTFPQGPASVTNAGGLSAFGTTAQGGNVWEWTESAFDLSNNSITESRERRGGSWIIPDSTYLEASFRNSGGPGGRPGDVGFRVASVPEPSSLSLLVLGGVVVALGRRKRS